MLGIPRNALPDDYSGLASYTQAMRNSDVLTVSAAARRLADQILGSTGSWFRAPASYQALTAGMLPDRLRHDFGLTYGEAERRASERTVKRVRRAYFLAPRRLRYVGPYYEASQRLAGRARPDLGTRLSNRLWIGRPSLAS
jgi:uncharacterized protein (DUF2236 family)